MSITMDTQRLTEQWDWRCAACGYSCSHVNAASMVAPSGVATPEPEPEPAEPVPVIHGGIIGYRAWRIVDWQLYGTGVNRAWVPGVNEATCDVGSTTDQYIRMFLLASGTGSHPAPSLGCSCGITALARFTEDDGHWSNADVHGAIEAWGEGGRTQRVEPGDVAEATDVLTIDVIAKMYDLPPGIVRPRPEQSDRDSGGFILHGTGFRAQYAKVVLLAVNDDWPIAKKAAVRALATEHGADVCKHDHLEDAAKEHGQLVPDEMLEWAKEGDTTTDVLILPPGGATITFPSIAPAAHSYITFPTYPNAAKGAHQRWHVNRGIVKPGCRYCELDDADE